VRPLRPTINQEWLDRNREAAQAGLQALGLLGFWETIVTIQPSGDWPQQQLRDAVAASTIRTFGWPIGISFDRDGQRPRPTAGGVVAQVTISSGQSRSKSLGSYDYWNLQRTGDFYFLRSIFEDELGRTTELFYNTRIVQVTEMLLFLARLYGQQLRLTDSTILSIKMTHGGLEGRYLTAIGSRSSFSRTFGRSAETQIETDLTTTVGELEPLLVEHVKTLLAPVFTLFDFTAIHDSTWTDIVDRFVAGDVS